MDKEFLYGQALNLWRVIEMEGRAFPANNISVAVTGFDDVEDGVQGIQGFLVKNPSSSRSLNSAKSEVVGRSKRDESPGITKYFSQTVGDSLAREKRSMKEQGEDYKDDLETEDRENDREDTIEPDDTSYSCQKCGVRITYNEMEMHEDYHVALELSRESPPPPTKAGIDSQPKKREMKEPSKPQVKRGKREEKGQMKLEFSRFT